MNARALRRLCLGFAGAVEERPFGPETTTFKVAGKIFAISALEREPLSVSLKCDPELVPDLRAAHPAIRPGYHLDKRHWNTVGLDGSLDDGFVRDLVEDSYDLVVSKLPQRVQRELGVGAGVTVLVTGATDGLGREVARDLAARGARVLVHGRSAERARAVADEIGAAGVHLADFASLAQVRALAEELPPVDVLVNNAGLMSQERVVTEDGCELTFQVNHLAHFLLTLRLLERSAPRRVVNVASAGQEPPDFDDLMLERGYEPWRAYRQSKLAQIMFAFELAERRPDVESTALHPATFMDTKMVRETVGRPHSTVEQGVKATVRLIAEPDLDVSGRYFDGTREAEPDPIARDAGARRRLWEASERLTA